MSYMGELAIKRLNKEREEKLSYKTDHKEHKYKYTGNDDECFCLDCKKYFNWYDEDDK